MLLLTETQLTPSDSDNDIQDHLYVFILNRQDNNDNRYSSLAFCSQKNGVHQKERVPSSHKCFDVHGSF